jgi:hypothetical protein
VPEVDVLGQVVPAISAAVGAYGVGVLTRAEDAAADGTVRLGQRLLGRVLRRGPAPEVERAVRALADAAPDEAEDAQAGLRLVLRKLLKQDPQLAGHLAGMLPQSAPVALGEQSIAVGGNSSGINSTGNNAVNVQHR